MPEVTWFIKDGVGLEPDFVFRAVALSRHPHHTRMWRNEEIILPQNRVAIFLLRRAGISLVFSFSSLENWFYSSTNSGERVFSTNHTHKGQNHTTHALQRDEGQENTSTRICWSVLLLH